MKLKQIAEIIQGHIDIEDWDKGGLYEAVHILGKIDIQERLNTISSILILFREKALQKPDEVINYLEKEKERIQEELNQIF